MSFTILKIGFRKGIDFFAKHLPQILMGLGTGGVVTTTVFAVRATPKAMKLIEEKKKEDDTDTLSKKDIVKTCWKVYTPTALMGVASLACFFGAHGLVAHQAATLASAYSMAEKTLEEYQKKVVETIGEKEEYDIRKKVAQDKLRERKEELKSFQPATNEMFACLDTMTGQIFSSNRQTLDHLALVMRDQIRGRMYVSKNEWLDMCGQRRTYDGDDMFWNEETGFDILVTLPDEYDYGAVYAIDYLVPPKPRANMYS